LVISKSESPVPISLQPGRQGKLKGDSMVSLNMRSYVSAGQCDNFSMSGLRLWGGRKLLGSRRGVQQSLVASSSLDHTAASAPPPRPRRHQDSEETSPRREDGRRMENHCWTRICTAASRQAVSSLNGRCSAHRRLPLIGSRVTAPSPQPARYSVLSLLPRL